MKAMKVSRVLFLENRSITDIWAGIADLLKGDFECILLRFNRAYGGNFPGEIVDLGVSREVTSSEDQRIESFVRMLCQTDRASYLHGATEFEIRAAVRAVFASLGRIDFDLVVGEVTSVYERAVEYYCRNRNIRFLAPMTARIPPDQFVFLDGASLFPLPIPASSVEIDGGCLGDGVAEAHRNAGANNLAIVVAHSVRMRNAARTLVGWLLGERLHSPSPWRKLFLVWRTARSKSWLGRIPLAGIEEVGSAAVIYCMHVQPESTLDTYSPEFWNQAEVIREIARVCEVAGRPFFVRPHPRWRHEIALHLEKLSISNLRVLSPDVAMKDLLRCCPTIVTVSGTVLIEAAVAGVPTVALDRSYLAEFPGVMHAPPADFGKVLSNDIVMLPGSAEAQREWFKELGKFTHQGLISPPEWSKDALSHKNLSDIANGVRLAVLWCNQHPEEQSE